MDVIMNNNSSENLNTITHLNQQVTKPITNTTTTSYMSSSQRRGSNHSAKSPKSSTSSSTQNYHHQYEDLNSLILPAPITDSPISPASPSSPASPQISTIANINNSCNNHRHILPNRSSKSTEATILTHTLPRRSPSMNSQISSHLNFSNISPQIGSSSSSSLIPSSSPSSSSSSYSSSQYTQSDSNQLLKSPARVRSPSSSTARSSKSLSPRLNSFKFESLNNIGNYDSSISNGKGEHLIETMEKEQEGLVLKLMREIQALKEENRHLKQQLSNYNRCSSPINSLTNNTININNNSSSPGLNSHNLSISSSNSNNNNNLIFSNLSDFNVNSNNNSSNSGNNGVNNNGSNGLNFSNLQKRRSASVSAVRIDSDDLKMDNTTSNNNNNSHNNYHTTNHNRNSISSLGSQFSTNSNSNSSGLLTRRSTITSLNSQKRLPNFNSVSSTNSLNLSIPDMDSLNSVSNTNTNTNTNYIHPSLMISGGNESLRKNRKMGGFNNSHQDKFENYNISAAMNK